jgi:hypothetical protein
MMPALAIRTSSRFGAIERNLLGYAEGWRNLLRCLDYSLDLLCITPSEEDVGGIMLCKPKDSLLSKTGSSCAAK